MRVPSTSLEVVSRCPDLQIHRPISSPIPSGGTSGQPTEAVMSTSPVPHHESRHFTIPHQIYRELVVRVVSGGALESCNWTTFGEVCSIRELRRRRYHNNRLHLEKNACDWGRGSLHLRRDGLSARKAGVLTTVSECQQKLEQHPDESHIFHTREDLPINRIIRRRGPPRLGWRFKKSFSRISKPFESSCSQAGSIEQLINNLHSAPSPRRLAVAPIAAMRDTDWERLERFCHQTALDWVNDATMGLFRSATSRGRKSLNAVTPKARTRY